VAAAAHAPVTAPFALLHLMELVQMPLLAAGMVGVVHALET
jgi:hypothetical protein